MASAPRHLALHASLVLSFGVLLGAPYSRAINRGAAAQIVNSWRVAHQSLSLAAGLMFAIAAVLPLLAAPAAAVWFVVVTLVASSYAFCVSMPLAAMTGHRGLSSDGTGSGWSTTAICSARGSRCSRVQVLSWPAPRP